MLKRSSAVYMPNCPYKEPYTSSGNLPKQCVFYDDGKSKFVKLQYNRCDDYREWQYTDK